MKQFKGKKIKPILAYLLCMALVFENTGFTALAEEVQTPVVEAVSDGDVVSEGDVVSAGDVVSDGNVVSGGDVVSAGDVVSDGDVISGGDTVSGGDISGNATSQVLADNIASGTYCEGVTWTLSADGLLTIEGTAADSLTVDRNNYTRGWADYADQIITAKVNTKGIKSFLEFFYGCTKLESVDFTGTDTSDAQYMAFMFYGCSALKTLDVSGFDTGNVTAMNSMFSGCSSLESLDVTGFDTSKATSFNGLFNGCESLKSVDVSGFKTEQVTNLSLMFNRCKSLKELKLSNFNTEKVFDTNQMFYGCSSLTSLDLSNFDTSNVKLISKMFSGCTSLESVDMSSWSLASLYEGTGTDVFKDCNNLETIKAPKALGTEVMLPYTMYSDAGIPYTALPMNSSESILLYKENPSDTVIVAYGKYYGMDWILNDEGELVISSTYDETQVGVSWDDYREDVVSVKVSATDVTSTANWFKDMTQLESVDVSEFDTSKVTNMDYMFYNCSGLTELDLSNCDIDRIYSMNSMFAECTNLVELKFMDAEKSGILMDMTAMFKNCKSLEELDMSSFWLGYLVDYEDAFSGMESLYVLHTPTFVPELVELPHTMYDATQREYYYLPEWSEFSVVLTKEKPADDAVAASGVYYGMDWSINGKGEMTISGAYDDTAEGTSWSAYADYVRSVKVTATGVKSTSNWFYYMDNLLSCDFSSFDTSQVTDMSYMFFKCTSLVELDVTQFDTSNVENMSYMFAYCTSLASLDVSNFNTSKVTNMQSTFSNCEVLNWIDVSGFDTSNVTDFGALFMDCHALRYVDVSGFDTAKAERMSYFFCGCHSLEKLDLSNFDTSKVQDMRYMFFECYALKTLDVSSFNTALVTTMDSMFRNCESLTVLDLSHFNTSLVEDMDYMFGESALLTELDLSSFSAESLKTADYMFMSCKALKKLDMGSMELKQLTSADNMLWDCGLLLQVNAPRLLNLDIELPYTMADEAGNLYDTLPKMSETSLLLKQPVFGIAPIPNQMYTGKAIKPEVTVMYGDVVLTKGVDYTVSYKNNVNAAEADAVNSKGKSIAPTVVVKGKGNYTGTVQSTFTIEPIDLWFSDDVVVSEMIVYENGKKQTNFKPTVTVNGRKMVYKKDFEIDYFRTTEGAYQLPGTYPVYIVGNGNYHFIQSADVVILDKDQVKASKLKVGKIATYTYNANKPAMPTPTVSYKGEELKLGRDYSISYQNNNKPGKATLVITGLESHIGTYVAGTVTKTFTIKGTAISKVKVAYNNKATFTGDEICPAVTLTIGKGDAAKTLRPYYDYTVSYTNNVKVGKGTIVITGCGEYTGTVKKTFTIQAKTVDVNALTVSFAGGKAEAAYVQSGAKPELSVMLGDVELVAGKDYTVSYKNNKKLAAADAKKAPTMFLKGKGNYKFTKNVTFDIVQKNLGDADIIVTATDKVVGSKSLLSAPVVTDVNGKKLNAKKDYTVSYTVNGVAFDGKTAEAGTVVTVTVTAKDGGNYVGTNSTTYRVVNNDITKAKIVIKKQEYNNGEFVFTEEMIKNGAIVITNKTTKAELVYGEDYIITGYKNNTKKGSATVTIQGIGEYGGTKNVKFSIVSKKL